VLAIDVLRISSWIPYALLEKRTVRYSSKEIADKFFKARLVESALKLVRIILFKDRIVSKGHKDQHRFVWLLFLL